MHYLFMTVLTVFSLSLSAQQFPPEPTEVVLGWDIPTEWDNDTPLALSDIKGYELKSDCLDSVFEIADPEQTSVAFPLNQFSVCDWQIRTVAINNRRSPYSNTVTAEFKTPKAPVLRRVSF